MKQCASGEYRVAASKRLEWERKPAVSPLPVSCRAESVARAAERARRRPSAARTAPIDFELLELNERQNPPYI